MSLAIRHILVLCEGNHCRSPLAEAMLRQELGPEFTIGSAGFRPLLDHPAHEEAQRFMAEQGIDISGHRGRQFTLELALGADLILVMDEAQKKTCERMIPSVRGRVYLLGHWLAPSERQIADPFDRGSEAHRRAYDHIRCALHPWLSRIAPRNP